MFVAWKEVGAVYVWKEEGEVCEWEGERVV